MFKTAPQWLSGVSVFLGDDINQRDTDGELVVFIGQAQKGPTKPVTLRNSDYASVIYGTNNPLSKAIYEFMDGYNDSPQSVPVKLVAIRIGGINASLVTSFGVTITTNDAYDGIEDDFYVYINNATPQDALIKIWNKNKQVVYDSKSNIDLGYFSVYGTLKGDGGVKAIYGVDLDNDIEALPVTLKQMAMKDIVMNVNVTGPVAIGDTSLSLTTVADADFVRFPDKGTIQLSGKNGAFSKSVFVEYTAKDLATKKITLKAPIDTTNDLTGYSNIKAGYIGSLFIAGDSQLNLTNRQLYEKLGNQLLEIETFTPDYIVPAVRFDSTDEYIKTIESTTVLKAPVTNADTTILVDAAATWESTGVVELYNGTDSDFIKYKAKTATLTDYTIVLDLPTFQLANNITAGDTFALVTADTAKGLTQAGYLKFTDGANTEVLAFKKDPTVENKILFNATGLPTKAYATASATVAQVPGVYADPSAILIRSSYKKLSKFNLGIGYVLEEDMGDKIQYTWSDVPKPGYGVAHFGYLVARFCNNGAVEYNIPLCGMNVELPSQYDYSTLVKWIGTLPKYGVSLGNSNGVENVVENGSGLLGNPILTGSKEYNRCYMSNPTDGEFVDPGYGLLMTQEGFVDGHELKDGYNNVVDLGKFMCLGAGLLTFNNRASSTPYVDTCGIYAIGMLAGKPKAEGMSFSKIGSRSNTTVQTYIKRKLYNDLAFAGYVVITSEKDLGYVINNDKSLARKDSEYLLISTTRQVKTVVERKRSDVSGFIGKPLNTSIMESLKTKLAASLKDDIEEGIIQNGDFEVTAAPSALAIGRLYIKLSIATALEITRIDIDTIVDRSIVS